jgi:hypothetical protein
MLWYKAWLETRWRFLIGLAVLVVLAGGTVLEWPAIQRLLPMARSLEPGDTLLGRAIRDGAQVQQTYGGFIWWQVFKQNMSQTGTLFAVLLGCGGLLAGRTALFTLSMPASRARLLGVQAAAGLTELAVLAFVPALAIPLLSPAVGQSYSILAALVHGTCIFVAGSVFFSLAMLLSTVFSDFWRPLLVACAIAFVVGMIEQVVQSTSPLAIFAVMSGETYFRNGAVPWAGLLIAAALSAALLYGATVNFAQREF